MLTLNSLYTRIGNREYTDSTYTTGIFLEDAHIIAQDLWSDIIYARKGDRNWDIFYADTVALQDEYTAQKNVTSTILGIGWIESVSIAYASDTYSETGNLKYVPCRQATIEEKKNWTQLLEEQPKDQPIYFESDGSYFIAPEPRTSQIGVGRLKVTGARSVTSGSWTTATTDTETKLPMFLVDSLYYGIVWKANEFMRRDPGIVQQKYNFYIEHKIRNIRKLNDEKSELLDSSLPPDQILGYD